MGKKVKFILVGLIGVSVIFGILFFQALTSKQGIINERDELIKINAELNGRAERFKKDIENYSQKISSLTKDMETLTKEKQEIETQYQTVSQERDELVQKVQELEKRKFVAVQPKIEPESREPEISDAYWAAIVKENRGLKIQLEDLRNELESLRLDNENLNSEKVNLEFEIKNFVHDNEDLKRMADYNRRLADSMSTDLVRERDDRVRTRDTFEKLRGETKLIRKENKLLTEQLKRLTNRKIALEEKIKDLQLQKSDFADTLSILESGVSVDTQQQEQVLKRESTIELPPIVVRPQSTPQASKSAARESAVLAVNMDNNFVVIDIGSDEGVGVGDIFRVTRNNRHIADIQVIQIRKNISACDIKNLNSPVRVGDKIR